MADVERIALFPLNTVLFPGMWLPLQIFEERYKIMLADCGMVEGMFGVTLIREGSEVGPAATPFDVGTVARIARAVPTPDQRIFIQTQGTRRFRIHRLLHDRPYLSAEVAFLGPVPGEAERTRQALDAVIEGYGKYAELVRRLGGQMADLPSPPAEPEFVSWMVASTLLVPARMHQQLLETHDVATRLEHEADLLAQVHAALSQRAARQGGTRPGNHPFSLN
jgi:Lon protease-like protein